MKRCLLIALALFMFCKPACAEIINPDSMTVKQLYDIETKTDTLSDDELNSLLAMNGYLLGIINFNYLRYYVNNHKEIANCIGRPLNVWKPLVFDKYKLNKIQGFGIFDLHLIAVIEEVCEVRLFNPIEPQIKISKVIDGDTVKIIKNNEEITVRLADIDCFETSANSRGKWQAEYYNKSIDEVIRLGKFSKSMLHAAVISEPITTGKKVILIEKGKDKYNRTLGYLFINGEYINEYMMRVGKCEKYIPRK